MSVSHRYLIGIGISSVSRRYIWGISSVSPRYHIGGTGPPSHEQLIGITTAATVSVSQTQMVGTVGGQCCLQVCWSKWFYCVAKTWFTSQSCRQGRGTGGRWNSCLHTMKFLHYPDNYHQQPAIATSNPQSPLAITPSNPQLPLAITPNTPQLPLAITTRNPQLLPITTRNYHRTRKAVIGCLGAWVPGCLGAWVPGCLGVCVPGCLGAWCLVRGAWWW